MLTKDAYYEKLITRRQDHLKFADMTQSLTGRIIVDKSVDEFETLFPFKEACAHLQNFPTRTTSSYACWRRKCPN